MTSLVKPRNQPVSTKTSTSTSKSKEDSLLMAEVRYNLKAQLRTMRILCLSTKVYTKEQSSFLHFIVACSFPIIKAQEFSLLIREKKAHDICKVESLRQ